MKGNMEIKIESAELYDINNYSFSNLKAKFKVIIDSPEEGGSSKDWSPKESSVVGKNPFWNEVYKFEIDGETQFALDVYDTDPKNTRSVNRV
jgi:hypothetical protein